MRAVEARLLRRRAPARRFSAPRLRELSSGVENVSGMVLDANLAPYSLQSALGIQQKRRAFYAHVGAAERRFLTPQTKRLDAGMQLVAGEINAQPALGAEFRMAFEAVRGDTDQRYAQRREIGSEGGKCNRLVGTGRGIVLRIEEQHRRVSGQRPVRNCRAIFHGQLESRRRAAEFEFAHHLKFLPKAIELRLCSWMIKLIA
jgi:hypothetical protein